MALIVLRCPDRLYTPISPTASTSGPLLRGPKTPWFFSVADGRPFAIAGLWEVWRSPDGEERPGVAPLTTEANSVVAPTHHRMPVMLPRNAFGAWLAQDDADVAALAPLLRPAPPEMMRAWPVSRAVNVPRNDGPELVEPVSDAGRVERHRN